MQSFSVIFNDKDFSEEKWIDAALEHTNIKSNKYTFINDFFIENLRKATWHMDVPINHPNSLGLLLLSENSRSKTSVMLSGEGADEIFGGYSRIMYANFKNNFKNIVKYIPIINEKIKTSYGERFDVDKDLFFILSSSFSSMESLKNIYPSFNIDNAIRNRIEIFKNNSDDYIQSCLNYDFETYLPELLMRQDKMTMANSIENRVPFLDEDLISLVDQIPHQHLVTSKIYFNNIVSRNTKVILKKISSKFFNDSFVHRPKSGFGIPMKDILSSKNMKEECYDLILPKIKERGIFNYINIKKNYDNLDELNNYNLESIWSAISFEVWCQTFIDYKN